MVLNRYEYSEIKNDALPEKWKTQSALDELKEFLQQNWNQRSAFYNDNNEERKQQFLDFIGSNGIKTKKYIGTIVYKGEQLNIFPRVFKPKPGEYSADNLTTKYLLTNLLKWIEYCNKLDYPFLNISAENKDFEDLKDLFITLYINYVLSAIERGVYFRYIEETEKCRSIKGKLDLKDYLIVKIPSGQATSFQCTYSSFEFDNKVNRIIKYTCKQLYKIASVKNQRNLRNILSRLNEVSDVSCSPRDCDGIRLGNMHKKYGIIISMSKMFLLNKLSGYDVDTNESFCFLFPTELLFEGFVGGYMKEVLSGSEWKISLQESKVRLVERIVFNGISSDPKFTLRHDILARNDEKVVILDTKYKEISRFENNSHLVDNINKQVKQADLYQMVTYAWKRGVSDVYLLYPMFRCETEEIEYPFAVCESPTGNIIIHFIRLPFVFEDDETNVKETLANVISYIFNR